MRLRIHKRKVLALLVALALAAACALALWGSGPGAREEEQEQDAVEGVGEGGPGDLARREEGGEQPAPEPGPAPSSSKSKSSKSSSSRPGSRRPAANASSSSSSVGPEALEALLGPNATLHYRSLVYRQNFDQPVRGAAARWQAALEADTEDADTGDAAAEAAIPLAVVVQVHARASHLRQLLASLRRAVASEAASSKSGPADGAGSRLLLVLSHDVWSPELNALAASVDFCAVLQVFFPFSLQLYPGEFPGTDPRDCPRDVGRAEALRRGCLNARYPDAFGHYREAPFAQAKHHWWWKLHFAWERVRALRGHRGPVLFLEEDHYLAPDALHVLRRLWRLRPRLCPDCQVLSLGSYAPLRAEALDARAGLAEVKTWKSTEHNMGLAFGREVYQQLRACTDAFCTYDDYNWDWTLQHLTVACLPRFWKVLVPEVPRVFHTGGCGMHHRARACAPDAQTAKIDALLEAHRARLFPESLEVGKRFPAAPLSPHVKNGGWGDIRDHELCKSYRRLQ